MTIIGKYSLKPIKDANLSNKFTSFEVHDNEHIIVNRSRITSKDIWQKRLKSDEFTILYHIFLPLSLCNYT